MKSYIQGMITGGVLVFAIMVLMGATGSRNQVGTYTIAHLSGISGPLKGILNTKTGVFIQEVNGTRYWYDFPNNTITVRRHTQLD